MASRCWQEVPVFPAGWDPQTACSGLPPCDLYLESTSVACNAEACHMVAGVGDAIIEETPTYCAVRS